MSYFSQKPQFREDSAPEITEKVVYINRCAKVVKGGRRFSFSSLVVAGDQKGRVGIGYGKANAVPDAIRKGVDSARRSLIRVPLRGQTIPYQVIGEFNASQVLLKPAAPGTGIIAGGGPRYVLDLVGVHDILTKCHGSGNIINVVKATFEGLRALRDARKLAMLRGKTPVGQATITLLRINQAERVSHRQALMQLGMWE